MNIRLENNTNEIICINPNETIELQVSDESFRSTVKRIKKYSVTELLRSFN